MGVTKNEVSNAILKPLTVFLTPMNSVFTQMIGNKIKCHFNNSMFFIKKYN